MAVNQTGEKKNVGVPIIILAAVLGIAIIAFIGYRAFNPPQPPATGATLKFNDWVSQLKKQSGGDFSKLSKADQDKLNNQTMGHGAAALQQAQ